jgi:hypothetical protein
MKKIFLVIFLLSVAILLFSQTEDFSPIKDYKILMQKYFPRDENSPEERELIEYIKLFCDYNDLNYKITKIDNQQNIIANSYNIEIYINGSDKSKGKLIVFCPLNSAIINQKYCDNSISLQTVFDLITRCTYYSFDKDIVFVLSGANQSIKGRYLGAEYFLENSDDLSSSFVTIIDIMNFKSKIRISGSINKQAISSEILKKFFKINKKEYGIYFNRNEIYRSRFGIKKEENIVALFLKQKIKAVMFYNYDERYNEEIFFDSDYEKKISEFFYLWLLELDKTVIPFNTDFHYTYFNFFGLNIFISEFIQLLIYIVAFFLIIISRLVVPAFKKFHLKLLMDNAIYFIVLFLGYFILSLLPLFVFMPMSVFTESAKAYLNATIIYFLNIFFIPLLILYILFDYSKKIFKTTHSYVYIYGAFIFCVLNFIIFFLIDISIAIIYLWAIIILTISQFFNKKSGIKYLLYFISSIGLLILLFDLAFFDNAVMIASINPFVINFIFVLMTYPFMLLMLRGIIIFIYKNIVIKKNNIVITAFSIIIISIVILIIISIFTEQKKDVLRAKLICEQNKNISFLNLESNLPIGNLYLESGIKTESIYIARQKKDFIVYARKKPYSIDYNVNINYYSNHFVFLINSDKMIEYSKMYLVVPKDSLPFNSNIAYDKVDNAKYVDHNPQTEELYFFNAGRNPGNNVYFELDLKSYYKSRIYFIIEYPFIDPRIVFIKKTDKIVEYNSIFIEKLDFEEIVNKSKK